MYSTYFLKVFVIDKDQIKCIEDVLSDQLMNDLKIERVATCRIKCDEKIKADTNKIINDEFEEYEKNIDDANKD